MCRVNLKHSQLRIQLQEYPHRHFIAEENIGPCIKPPEIGIIHVKKLALGNLVFEGNFLFISQSSAFKLLVAANAKGDIRAKPEEYMSVSNLWPVQKVQRNFDIRNPCGRIIIAFAALPGMLKKLFLAPFTENRSPG